MKTVHRPGIFRERHPKRQVPPKNKEKTLRFLANFVTLNQLVFTKNMLPAKNDGGLNFSHIV